ncbi:sporulation protein [Paenisporosarcina indica]|uniref:sporulation protein n=1 Tax=Paenisporosarcina indica TaxID=650093 RepID=UPI00094F7CC5|nr:sporulation protein [Paenisporosarcina indica]
MLKKFLSSISYGSMKVDIVVDQPEIAYGETLSGTIYIMGGQSNQLIEFIKLEILKRTEGLQEDGDFNVTNNVVAKHTIEMVGSVKSKETRMIPFDLMPDERWESETVNEKLYLRTTVHINNAVDVHDEDEIIYGKDVG